MKKIYIAAGVIFMAVSMILLFIYYMVFTEKVWISDNVVYAFEKRYQDYYLRILKNTDEEDNSIYYAIIAKRNVANLIDAIERDMLSELKDRVLNYDFITDFTYDSKEVIVNIYCDYSKQDDGNELYLQRRLVEKLQKNTLEMCSMIYLLKYTNRFFEEGHVNVLENYSKGEKKVGHDEAEICEKEKEILYKYLKYKFFYVWSLSDNEYHIKEIISAPTDSDEEIDDVLDLSQLCNVTKIDLSKCRLRRVVLPNDLEKIDSGVIKISEYCAEEIKFPDNLEEIEHSTFFGLDGLKRVSLGDDLKCIGNMAFKNCYTLEKVELGKNVDYIGNEAFARCSHLKEVVFKGDSPTIMGKDVFGETPDDFTIYYDKSKKGWDDVYWKNYNLKPLE